jgi:hypothetical protein
MLDVNGQSIGDGTLELVKFAETASAVNEITVTNSATGNAPEIASSGDDTNIDLKLTPKGTGKLNLDGIKFPNADGSAGQALTTNGSGILSFSTISADGTADWDTTVKTTGFTATANKGFFCNTTSAAFTVTLPSSPSAGDEIIIVDYAGTFATNNLNITSTPKINGSTNDVKLTTNREATRLVYIDSTQGYIAYSGVNEGTAPSLTDNPPTYSIDYLVVAGGGAGGGAAENGGTPAAGGGAGGMKTGTDNLIIGNVYTITVGDGGAGQTGSTNVVGNNGSSSSISGTGLTTISTSGGGGGGGGPNNGSSGGSGGGAPSGSNAGTGVSGEGNNGGEDNSPAAGGGGGKGAVGQTAPSSTQSGAGGTGAASSITGSSVTYAGGGGGGGEDSISTGAGGSGGGGAGGGENNPGTSGTVNTGGGGGGGGPCNGSSYTSTSGGKGVVILRMLTADYSGTTTGSPTVTTDGSYKVLKYTGTGSYTA